MKEINKKNHMRKLYSRKENHGSVRKGEGRKKNHCKRIGTEKYEGMKEERKEKVYKEGRERR